MPEDETNPNPESQQQPEGENPILMGIKELSGIIKEYVTNRFRHDNTGLKIFAGIVIAILISIIILGLCGVLTENSIGTLMGSLIGYALGKFNSSNNGKERG